MYDLRVVVEEVKGFCDLPMRVGDYFEVRGGKLLIPEGKHMCIWALQSLIPMLPLKQRRIAEENDWVPHTHRMMCPDPNGMVIYRIEQIDPATRQVVAAESAKQQKPPARLIVDETCCTGCRTCETICSFHHTGSFNGERARIRIEKNELEGEDLPRVCHQCGDAPCVNACPVGALTRDAVTHAVLVDDAACIACGRCVRVCRFGAIHFHPGAKAPLICDLCGGSPECVQRCPVGALRYANAGELEGR